MRCSDTRLMIRMGASSLRTDERWSFGGILFQIVHLTQVAHPTASYDQIEGGHEK